MRIHVEGRHPLNGVYRPSGNPNAAFALLAASMLTDQPVTLRNIPRSANIEAMIALADRMGAHLTWDAETPSTLHVTTPQITQRVLTEADTASSVSFILLLAPILLRRQHVRLEFDFPLNRIRTHLDALRDLGIDVITVQGAVECRASRWDFKEIILSQASVTATALVMMLAVCQGVETIVHNAACEPHIRELAEMLEQMGAHIEGVGSNILRILSPPAAPGGAEVTLCPDHIEVGSIAAISALCGGRVQIANTRLADLRMIAKIYQRLGIQLDLDTTNVQVIERTFAGTLAKLQALGARMIIE
jgi:UDP-N-acetylglucosamine 1-carboxyvinyltransferase